LSIGTKSTYRHCNFFKEIGKVVELEKRQFSAGLPDGIFSNKKKKKFG
jgi:hypothetical protein